MTQQRTRGSTTEWRKLREACFRVWGKTCMYCGDRATEVDHILELALGGTNTIDNLQPLCKPCHLHKTVKFNTVRPKTQSGPWGVFSTRVAPADSLAGISPRMVRKDPPMAGKEPS
jgi:5-methylcytosine-specific restriction endonuclease McrA